MTQSLALNTVPWNSLMPAELGSLGEVLVTLVTLEWFLTSVGANVIVERSGARKRTRTVAAFEWLLSHMSDNMRAQLVWRAE